MVFTPYQDAFILMAHFRSGTKDANGVWTYSLQSCIEQFYEAFPGADVDYEAFVYRKHYILKRFNTKHCICKGKPPGRTSVLNQKTFHDIQARIDQSPNKSIRKLSTETGLSYGTCRKALKKNFHMHPYKVTVVQEIYPHDFEARVRFCRWFNEHLINDDILNLTFNVNILLQPFIAQLMDDELQEGYFQQDGATAYTAQDTITYLQQYFDDRLISRGRWPPRSPDLTPLDFLMFGHLKNRVYKNRPQNINELRQAIENEVNNITPITLVKVFDNLKRRVQLCLEHNGEHFQQFL